VRCLVNMAQLGQITWGVRASSALTWIPAGIVVALLAVVQNAQHPSPTWTDATAKASIAVIILAPLSAGVAAWESGKWRGVDWARANVRSSLTHALWTLKTLWLGTFGGFLIALALTGLAIDPRGGSPELLWLLMVWLVTVGHSLAGWTVGHFVPRSAAFALCAGGSFVWLTYLPAFEPFWLRNITGHQGTSCCDIDKVLAPEALWAPIILALAIAAGASIVIAARYSWRTIALLAVPILVIGVLWSRSMVEQFDADPVVLRKVAMACDSTGRIEVCFWPETTAQAKHKANEIAAAAERLIRAGAERPQGLTESARDGWWTFSSSAPTDNGLRLAVATGALGELPPSCAEGGNWPGASAYGPTLIWVGVKAGLPWAEARELAAPEDARAALDVLKRPARDQASWFVARRESLQRCE
jgi:hypothetical protein